MSPHSHEHLAVHHPNQTAPLASSGEVLWGRAPTGPDEPRRSGWRPLSVSARYLLVSAVALLALAACGSSAPAAVSKSAPSTTSTTTSTTTHQQLRCSSAQLRLRFINEGVATGTRIIGVMILNRGPSSCEIAGYPTSVALLGSHGAMPTAVRRHITRAPTPSIKPTTIKLDQGDRASFILTMGDGSILRPHAPNCPVVTGISVRLRGPGRSIGPFLSGDIPKSFAQSVPVQAFPYRPGGRCNSVDVSFLVKGPPRDLMSPVGAHW